MTLDELLGKAGKEFAERHNHEIMDLMLKQSTCFVCHDDNENHNKCRNRACYSQLSKERRK